MIGLMYHSGYGTFVSHLDLSRAPYVLYGVKYIDLVSLGAFAPRYFLFSHHRSHERGKFHDARCFLFSYHIYVYMR